MTTPDQPAPDEPVARVAVADSEPVAPAETLSCICVVAVIQLPLLSSCASVKPDGLLNPHVSVLPAWSSWANHTRSSLVTAVRPVSDTVIGVELLLVSTVGVDTVAGAVLLLPENATIWTMARFVPLEVKLTASDPVAFFFSKTLTLWPSGPELSSVASADVLHPVAALMVCPATSCVMNASNLSPAAVPDGREPVRVAPDPSVIRVEVDER